MSLDINDLPGDPPIYVTTSPPAKPPKKKSSTPETSEESLSTIIEEIMDDGGSAFAKRRSVAEAVNAVLLKRGNLVHSDTEALKYYALEKHELYDLRTEQFEHKLSSETGLCRTESEYKYVLEQLKTRAAMLPAVPEYTLGHIDIDTGCLDISDGSTGVWHRDRGGEWLREYNGQRTVFFRDRKAQPWIPEFGTPGQLDWFLSLMLFDSGKTLSVNDRRTLTKINLLHMYMDELRRTRMIPLAIGAQGSGKSSYGRLHGRLIVGPRFEVQSLNDKRRDDLETSLAGSLFMVIDNADNGNVAWFPDFLASYATGQTGSRRKLYADLDIIDVASRAGLMLNSRTGPFRRSDVVERLLPFSFAPSKHRTAEFKIYRELNVRRGAIMGEILTLLGQIADRLGDAEPPEMTFRMADFGEFAWRVLDLDGRGDECIPLLDRLEQAQTEFSAEEDTLITVLDILLNSPESSPYADTAHTTAEWFTLLQSIAADQKLPFVRSPMSLGHKFTGLKKAIEVKLGVRLVEAISSGKRMIGLEKV